MRVFGVIGWKNSGKTGLVTRLVAEITGRGFTVSTVKHAHHRFSLARRDAAGQEVLPAGAQEAIFASPTRWAMVRLADATRAADFADLLRELAPVDLVLVEGYKLQGHPKIEAYRPETGQDLIARRDRTILAVASTAPLSALSCPLFDLDDTGAIADFVLAQSGLA